MDQPLSDIDYAFTYGRKFLFATSNLLQIPPSSRTRAADPILSQAMQGCFFPQVLLRSISLQLLFTY